jgi:predicted ATPase
MLDINKFPLRQQLKVVDIKKDLDLDAHDVGTGISQVVPVVVTALVDHDRLLAIEQPELHLHPKLQAELGDLFIEAALGERKQQLILETHSEHLILRLLRRIRETTSDDLPENKSELTPGDVTIFYIEQTEEGARVTTLAIDGSGEFVDRWPQGFFAERGKELF